MGWTVYRRRPADPRAELRSLVTRYGPDGSRRPLADAFVGSTWYAAVEDITPDGASHVWAAVFLVKRGKEFGYKDMCESMGPCEDRCPKRVLDLLTPLDETYPHVGYAADWRARCRSNLAGPKRSPLQDGALVSFQAPYALPSGPCSTFTARRHSRRGRHVWRFYALDGSGPYLLRNWRQLQLVSPATGPVRGIGAPRQEPLL